KEDTIVIKTNLSFLPTNENNLVYKAIKLLKSEFQIQKGVFVNLEKHIPVAAGMAGGSTDCAAALRGMNRLFGLGLTDDELMKRAVTLGADVPYCIMGGTALSEGIGEILTPLSPMPSCYVLVVKPSMHVSTKFVYENLDIASFSSHPDIDGMVQALQDKDLSGISSRLNNVLETVTIKEYPILGQIKNTMKQSGALGSIMSGSGPTVFGLFDNKVAAEEAKRKCKKMDSSFRIYLVDVKNSI
ncbi:MAG: 4-diphosphocytidyl-2-C-methyl-D-erythritol kinase, partial [Clostridiales bacterium]|nr:4-diphosphocytidyl-2-C-methyl-D-erythritol kinase [Clostridiales bacterium]